MKRMSYNKMYLIACAVVLLLCTYPVAMGIKVIVQVAQSGAIPVEEYPKYIIPYTPIALALLVGVVLLPLFRKMKAKKALFYGSAAALTVFFIAEWLMETKILVQTTELVPLESWQMSLCYVPPEMYETRTWEAVDILLGGYSPAFKLHFYLISVVIVISVLNCIYGFAHMARTGNYDKKKALTVQAATSAAFLGMCIWACFTAFYRTGEITVSALSAVLMSVFFILLGVTVGVSVGAFTLHKKRLLSVGAPALTAVLVTVFMYVGEMILLSGNLYRFGSGFLFSGLGALVLAPVDLLVIAAAGGITALISAALQRNKRIVAEE